MSVDQYAKVQKTTMSARDAEYTAFARSTRALMDASENKDDFKQLANAIHINRSLWETLAHDCASDKNALPENTRAAIISLARWVSSESRNIIRKKADIGSLIDVNRIIMDGLAGRASQQK